MPPVPEVKTVLDAIQNNLVGYGNGGYGRYGYGHSTLADVPLERIDRDHSTNLDKADGIASLDGPVHERDKHLQGMNFVGARSATQTDTPLGSQYDHGTERIVGVRVEGATVLGGEYGAIDPHKGTSNEASRDYPTTRWDWLTRDIQVAILRERFAPASHHPEVAFKDLFIENVADSSAEWGQFFRLDFDVRFSGFRDLP